MVCEEGIEPSTFGLEIHCTIRCATRRFGCEDGIRTHDILVMSQLSYRCSTPLYNGFRGWDRTTARRIKACCLTTWLHGSINAQPSSGRATKFFTWQNNLVHGCGSNRNLIRKNLDLVIGSFLVLTTFPCRVNFLINHLFHTLLQVL